MSPSGTSVPTIETFRVTSTAPLATADEDSPSIVNFRDTSIENQYIEIRRLTKPLEINEHQYLTEYDSCTVLSSADPSISGYRRRQDPNNDDDTISSKSDMTNDDEHVQISHMITTSFMHDDQFEKFKTITIIL